MPYEVAVEDFDSLQAPWSTLLEGCSSCSAFLTPEWHRTWWRHFGTGEPLLLAVRHGNELVGVAPLMETEDGLSGMGSSDVSDYLDFPCLPGHEAAACQAVLGFLEGREWRRLLLFSLPERSVALEHFLPIAGAAGYHVAVEPDDVCPSVDLPGTWDSYLSLLGGTPRHELRRKLRRLAREPGVGFTVNTGAHRLASDMEDFFSLFLDSKEGKADFLTPQKRAFFSDLAQAFSTRGWLKVFFMAIGSARVAAAMVFDYGNTFYLYNSGYDRRCAQLSVGLLLKAQCIREGINLGRKRFDFLRGDEPYKYDLGGQDHPLYRCVVSRTAA